MASYFEAFTSTQTISLAWTTTSGTNVFTCPSNKMAMISIKGAASGFGVGSSDPMTASLKNGTTNHGLFTVGSRSSGKLPAFNDGDASTHNQTFGTVFLSPSENLVFTYQNEGFTGSNISIIVYLYSA